MKHIIYYMGIFLLKEKNSLMSGQNKFLARDCEGLSLGRVGHNGENLFWSRRACVRHPLWRTKRSWPLFSPTFFFFFFFLLFSFSFSPPSTFHPLRGISRA